MADAKTKRTLFATVSAVQAALAAHGISKTQKNAHGNYLFRGIDDVLNTLAPILADNNLLIIPSVTSTEVKDVKTSTGKPSRLAVVGVDYHLYDQHGDSITHHAVGEAMDNSDKAINKAMTAAYKYFLFQAFCIPVKGTDDADSDTVEIGEATPEYINETQLNQINALLKTMDNPKSFTDWLGFPVEQLLAADYERINGMLTKVVSREYEEAAKAEALSREEITEGMGADE